MNLFFTMNISKNTEKRLPKINSNSFKTLPPIDSMDTWGAPVPDFIQKRTWMLKRILCVCLVFYIVVYTLKENVSWPLKQQVVTDKHLFQSSERETIQLNLNTDIVKPELTDYNANSQQAFLKIVPELPSNLMDATADFEEEHAKASESIAQQIRAWLHQQHIQGVAYKDFESCIVINGKIFHLNEVVAPELNLVWSDIDPVSKKLFFYDANGVLYFINY